MASKWNVSARSFRFNENVIPARNRRPKLADVWMLSTLLLLPPLIPRLAAHRPVNVPAGAVTLEDQIPSAPRPPCTTEAYPAYPSLGAPPAVTVWSAEALGHDWIPPACTDWIIPGFSTLVTTVARFHCSSNADGLLQRLGAISALKGLRYWSVTRKRWRILVVDADVVSALQGDHIRADFTPEELKAGKPLYFEQTDNLSGRATYQMNVVEISATRVVVEVENVTTIHYLVVPLLRPGDLQSIYFLDRESDDVWRYYSIVRTGTAASRMIGRNDSSAVNRAVAFYRHLAGIADNREPPAAP